MAPPVLAVSGLKTHFLLRDGIVKAVDDVSFSVGGGEVLGLVGESGSGKTVTGWSIIGVLDPPGRVVAGSIRLDGEELVGRSEADLRRLRGRKIAMIFQDPMMTLNPVLRIDTQMIEAITAHERVSQRAARARAQAALAAVGIAAAGERLKAYPHQLSGGLRQRVAIATALLHRPLLLIADEPTTALDVTIQSQILAEVQALCADYGTALIWITHDLAVVSALADRIAVMYAGPHRRGRSGRGCALAAAASLHARADRLGAAPAPARRAARADPRRAALAHAPARGLRVCPALRARRRGLPDRAGDGRACARARHPLLASAWRKREPRMTQPIVALEGVSKRFVRAASTSRRAPPTCSAPASARRSCRRLTTLISRSAKARW